MGIRQRRIQANYLKINDKYEFLGTGFQTLDEKPSPKTTSKRYINDASASQSVTSYEWSCGSDAETEYLIVDLDKEAKNEGYRARKFKIAIQVDDFKNNDGELQCNGSFLGLGDPVEGTVTIAESTKEVEFTVGFEAKVTE